MKIYIAGGEALKAERQTAIFEAGCRNRLVSFYSGNTLNRVLEAAKEFSTQKKEE